MHGNQKSLESIALDVFHAVSISHSSAATNPTAGFSPVGPEYLCAVAKKPTHQLQLYQK